MDDRYGRIIDYIRLSVTDLCYRRCIYCMPEGGVEKLPHGSILSVEEIDEICIAAASLGIKKIRITGGEPLVRRGIDEIVRNACTVPGIEEVCLTTNGTLLAKPFYETRVSRSDGSWRKETQGDAPISSSTPYTYARMLAGAGVNRVNISLDSLDPKVYNEITRGGDLADTVAGIDAAISEGLTPIKINAVLMGGINDDGIIDLAELTKRKHIHVRFIEIMPIGECAAWNKERFISGSAVTSAIPGLVPCGTDGVAEIYRRGDYAGTVGIIHPISGHFCPDCNKIRITADGRLKPCLHSGDEILLKGLRGDELTDAIRKGIEGKPIEHHLADGEASESQRGMNRVGG
jgi:cyclic pyranopterin phosphate synthase